MADQTDILLPADQTEGTTNTVGKWFKTVGDSVALNDPLLEITTDKVTVEIAAPAAGVLVEIVKSEGESVEPGEVLGRIGGEAPAGAARTAESRPPQGAQHGPPDRPTARTPEELSPAVRRLIQERGLDPSHIKGTGRGGRISVQDVEAHLAPGGDRPSAGPPARLVPHTPMRRSIADHMVRSVATAPHVTAVFEADLSRVLAHREAHGKTATLTAYFVRATVAALQAVPEVNSRWHDQGLELFDDCNIGIATALETGGLIVPVLHGAQGLDLGETATRLADLTARARGGKLEVREVQGGTFTISNHGVSGSLLAAPIVINQPQSAILGVGKLEQRVKPDGSGGFTARPMLYVSLTIDHRALDGFQANAFLSAWVEAIERWELSAPRVTGAEGIRTPALVIDLDAVSDNITATLRLLGDRPDRWRPHLKTAKLALIMGALVERGVRQAKCSTTLELETACKVGFSDVLLAYPVTEPQAAMVRRIATAFPAVTISVLVEDLRMLTPWRGSRVGIFIDLNPGMDRTGMLLDRYADILALVKVVGAAGLRYAGLHFYDGHANAFEPGEAEQRVHAGYDRLLALVRRLKTDGIDTREVITAGTPAFPHALGYSRFAEEGVIHRTSPGTVVYNDRKSLTQLPGDAGYRPAALVLSTVVSHPSPMRFCADAGHKSVSADAGVPTCEVLGSPEFQPRQPSEEHLPIDVPEGGRMPARGELVWLLPSHVCPTVNNFDHAVIVAGGVVRGIERVTARGRHAPLE